jgi:hypothetical protein
MILPSRESNQDIIADILMEGHMIKLLPNKEFVVDILEEIIEYREDNKTVLNYLVLVEQAKRDLKNIVKIWKVLETSEKEESSISE